MELTVKMEELVKCEEAVISANASMAMLEHIVNIVRYFVNISLKKF